MMHMTHSEVGRPIPLNFASYRLWWLLRRGGLFTARTLFRVRYRHRFYSPAVAATDGRAWYRPTTASSVGRPRHSKLL